MAGKRKKIQRDWVARRVNCSISGAFNKLGCIVKRDVEIFNELNTQNKFRFVANSKKTFSIGKPSPQNGDISPHSRFVTASIKGREIDVNTNICGKSCLKLTIKPVWNKESANCDFWVSNHKVDDEEPQTLCLNRTSQEIVGDLLFEELEGD